MSEIKTHCLLFALLMLTGCANSIPPSRPPIPANLASPCPTVNEIQSKSWDDLAKSYIDLAFQYSECSAKQAGLVKAWQP